MWKSLIATLLVSVVTLQGYLVYSSKDGNLPSEILEAGTEAVWSVWGSDDYESGHGTGYWVSGTVLVTACHVVRGAKEAWASNNDRSYQLHMQVDKCDEDLDIAILSRLDFSNKDGRLEVPLVKPIRILDGVLDRGQRVWALGYPLHAPLMTTKGYWQGPTYTSDPSPGVRHPTGIISANGLPGSSGGPILAFVNGEVVVVGMTVAGYGLPASAGFNMIWIPASFLHLVQYSDVILEYVNFGQYIEKPDASAKEEQESN